MRLSTFKEYNFLIKIILIFSFLLTSCEGESELYKIETVLNPNAIAPLSAQLKIIAKESCKASIKVLGQNPVEQAFETFSDSLHIPVVGLYPNKLNKVQVTLDFAEETVIDTISIQTEKLPELFPRIEINKLDRSKMENGMHACDAHFANDGKFRSMPFIFDDEGEVRWFLDLSFHGKMVSPFQRLKDGTVLMVGRHTIYEFDMLGQIVNQVQIDNNYGMHHDVLELPNGDLLICVGKRNAYINLDGEKVLSDSDFIIQYSRKTSKIVREWDIAKHLDVSRTDVSFLRPGDWLHMNGLAFDSKDNSIIISGRNQGLSKVSVNDELKWILSPKKNWGKSGREGEGLDTRPFLLTAVNSNNRAYNKAVQDGDKSLDDFDFSWGPHAPKILPNGNLLIFDNGFYRNYNNENNYSRAVEYEINEQERTVKQVWQYGKERETELYSAIVSDVDYLENTKNILFTSGFVTPQVNHSAKIVEVDYENKDEVFEATLYFKNLKGNRKPGWGQFDLLYRSQRMELKY